jgi:hypothetical protein
LGDTDLARQFADATNGADGFFEALIPHPNRLDSNDFNVKVALPNSGSIAEGYGYDFLLRQCTAMLTAVLGFF